MSFDPTQFGTGYRPDEEDYAHLLATASPFKLTQTYSAPHSVCHRSWRTAKNQGRVGSCVGFSRSSGEEVLNFIKTGGQIVHLSEMYCYLTSQKACGLFGRDVGATIDGSVRAATSTGTCLYDTFPYPGVYDTKIPDAAVEEGRKHLIRSHAVLRSYDSVYEWLSSGVGVVQIGVPWVSGLANNRGVVEYRDAKGSGGGHALILNGYNGSKCDSQGRCYIELENSHSPNWGDNGFALISPDTIQFWCDQGNALIGISDLEVFGPREIKTWGGRW